MNCKVALKIAGVKGYLYFYYVEFLRLHFLKKYFYYRRRRSRSRSPIIRRSRSKERYSRKRYSRSRSTSHRRRTSKEYSSRGGCRSSSRDCYDAKKRKRDDSPSHKNVQKQNKLAALTTNNTKQNSPFLTSGSSSVSFFTIYFL